MLASFRHSLLVILGVFAVSALSACDGSSSKPAATPTGDEQTTTSVAISTTVTSGASSAAVPNGTNASGKINEAVTIAAFLENTAKSWGDRALDLQQLADGLHQVYPKVDLVGSLIEASPTEVSAAATSLNSKDVPSTQNPNILAFAIADTTGTCRGKIVFGYPTTTEELSLTAEAGDDCTAQVMLAFAKKQIKAAS